MALASCRNERVSFNANYPWSILRDEIQKIAMGLDGNSGPQGGWGDASCGRLGRASAYCVSLMIQSPGRVPHQADRAVPPPSG